MTAAAKELRLELLLGRRVLALNGRSLGRIEEAYAEAQGPDLVVTEFHIGAFAAFERLSASNIGRAMLALFNLRGGRKGYRVPWDKLDLTNADHPRLTCSVDELENLS